MSTRCSGDDDDGEAERCRELVKKSFELAAKLCFGDVLGPLKKLGFWIYGKQALNLSKWYDELLEKILKEHEERDGTDTTAEAMQWTIAELLNHPDAFKVRQEIESVIGRTRLVEETDIPSLPYLQAVVKETLRLYPPAPVTTRECRQNCRIKGFDIPEKTAVSINLYAIMRDPDAWDNPENFARKGRRGCPGSMLAFAVMNTVIAAMVQCFDWNVNGDKIDTQPGPGMSMSMVHPLLCQPVVHFNPFAA
ncbi:hypothetical protein LWI29_038301 [Acer saccharum]|uniref:Cytochrome P450 n=1 Tax=Acer saccharum TaxID=4024 RepID=A0AA39RNH5_ACESA|nr:hypothetical protein LWI29_038301 [Acer saccharum]